MNSASVSLGDIPELEVTVGVSDVVGKGRSLDPVDVFSGILILVLVVMP
jgi:hypothetical protein